MYDLVIKHGKIADGESDELFYADVAIENGSIAAVGKEINPELARKSISAKGAVVAPGFVDIHSHSDYYLLIDRRGRSKLMQGVTTEIGGNCGYSAAPVFGNLKTERAKDYSDEFGLDVCWNSLAEYFNQLDLAKPCINFGALIGYNTIRGSVMGFADREPTIDDYKKINSTIEENLEMGAVGMSVGMVYPPACFASHEELSKVFGIVARYGKTFTSHIRSEGAGLLDALKEVIQIAENSGARLQVSHLKTAGEANWHKLEKALDLLESARDKGVNLMADRYPYLASNTGLSVVLPDRAFDGGRKKLLERLADKTERDKFREEILLNHAESSYWDGVMISQVVTDSNRDLEGVSVSQGADLRGKDIFDFVFDLLLDEGGSVEAIYFCMNEKNLEAIYNKPWVMVGSDAGARNVDGPLSIGRPHPRTFGTFPLFFEKYVREQKLCTITDAVKKCSTMACDHFGLKNRGRIKKGYIADITVFDPDTIADKSTYHDPLAYPLGIEQVIIGGKIAVANGVPVDSGAGMIIRS